MTNETPEEIMMEEAVFHSAKQAPAVLKHAILDKYVPPFASKTGSTSAGGRVGVVDGFAGPGRYADGDEGSGALLLRKARDLQKLPRNLQLHFVERDPATFHALEAVISAEGQGVSTAAYEDDLKAALPVVLEKVEGIPCLFYLDPCGLITPMSEVVAIFDARPGGLGTPATEVLLNFSATALRRIAGHLTSPKGVAKTLERMDEVCGGDWWRDAWLSNSSDASVAEAAVVSGYISELAKRAGGAGAWAIDVKQRPTHKPKYYLVFVTRHRDGMSYFGEASSKALEAWREALAKEATAGTLFEVAGDWEAIYKDSERLLREQWEATLLANLERVLKRGKSFTVWSEYGEIYGDLAGVARDMHLRAAWKTAHSRGLVKNSPVGLKGDIKGVLLHPTDTAESTGKP